MNRSLRCLTLACCALLLVAPSAFAQTTTGAIAGTVTAQADGSALPGAVVDAVHQPTGTRYNTVTDAEGRFRIFGVRVGGPFHAARHPGPPGRRVQALLRCPPGLRPGQPALSGVAHGGTSGLAAADALR